MADSARKENDYRGKEITRHELPCDEILIWVIAPPLHQQSGIDEVWIRSYQEMLEYVGSNIQDKLEEFDVESLLQHGVTIKIELRKVSLEEYLEAISDG